MSIASFLLVMIVILLGSLTIATLIVLLGLWLLDKDDKNDKYKLGGEDNDKS